MHPADRDLFPVTFTNRMDWQEVISRGHDYLWRHVVSPPSQKPKL